MSGSAGGLNVGHIIILRQSRTHLFSHRLVYLSLEVRTNGRGLLAGNPSRPLLARLHGLARVHTAHWKCWLAISTPLIPKLSCFSHSSRSGSALRRVPRKHVRSRLTRQRHRAHESRGSLELSRAGVLDSMLPMTAVLRFQSLFPV